jgi:hypothetical protein
MRIVTQARLHLGSSAGAAATRDARIPMRGAWDPSTLLAPLLLPMIPGYGRSRALLARLRGGRQGATPA